MTLYHVTLTTGHVVHQDRVAADVIRRLRSLVRVLLTSPGERRPVPGFDGYTVTAWTDYGDGNPLFAVHRADPLVTFGVATGAGGADLWRALHGLARQQAEGAGLPGAHGLDAQVDVDAVPSPPWCGVVPHVGLMEDYAARGTALDWVGDFECCLAWAVTDAAREGPAFG